MTQRLLDAARPFAEFAINAKILHDNPSFRLWSTHNEDGQMLVNATLSASDFQTLLDAYVAEDVLMQRGMAAMEQSNWVERLRARLGPWSWFAYFFGFAAGVAVGIGAI